MDSFTQLSAADDPLAHLIAEKAKRHVSLNNCSQTDRCVLILTHDYDPEVTLLTIKLRAKGIQCVRLNTNDIANEQLRVSYSIKSKSSIPDIEFAVGTHDLDPSRVSAVLLRQFDLKEINFCGDDLVRAFSFQQWASAFQTLQNSLKCSWISTFEATLKTSDCMRQLSAAKKIGFRVPATTITNDSTIARDFYRHNDGNVIIKSLHHHDLLLGNKLYSGYARRIGSSDLLEIDRDLASAPCVFQEEVAKKEELRVTVIGDEVFAAKLGRNFLRENQNEVDIHHFLSNSNFPIEKVNRLPDKILDGCIRLVKSLGLKFGAIDFAIDKNDDYFGNNNNNNDPIFIELNPTGEWYWIEARTGLRMTQAVADLVEGCMQ